MGVLSEDKIEKWILPYLSKGKRGFKTKFDFVKIIQLIFKRLKTGCQWRELSVKEYFDKDGPSWESVYYYFNKWSKDGSFRRVWINLLSKNKPTLDLSSVQLDGSHTPAKRGGEKVGYQGRKSCKTTNTLFLSDNTGQMLAAGSPQSGAHNDLYEVESILKEIIDVLEGAGISCKGLFLNADPGFDSEEVKGFCREKEIELNVKPNPRNCKQPEEDYRYFDDELYKRRTKIEHANAWMDAFKALLIRFETKAFTWMGLQWLSFIVRLCRKIKV